MANKKYSQYANITSLADGDFFPCETAAGVTKYSLWSLVKSTLKTYFDTIYLSLSDNASAWIPANETWTYASADAPTYTFTVNADVTTKYWPGQKIKYTQTTVKYGIITAVSSYTGGATTITIYGGGSTASPSYAMTNATITVNYYSNQKSPSGFPLSPATWTYEITDTNLKSKTGATTSTFYGGANAWTSGTNISIDAPIGLWRLGYEVTFQVQASAGVDGIAALSTSDNSASDQLLAAGISAQVNGGVFVKKEKVLSLASKTTYYLIFESLNGSGTLYIYIRGELGTTKVYAVCEYL